MTNNQSLIPRIPNYFFHRLLRLEIKTRQCITNPPLNTTSSIVINLIERYFYLCYDTL